MKNILIFLSIITVVILAAIDAKDRMNELDNIAIKTPAQVEMNKSLIQQKETQNPAPQSVKPQLQNPDNSFNNRIKQQQNNNLPQTKQNNPLN